MNAEPVAFLQFAQWQIRKVMGSPMISYFIDLHKQDPDRTVEEDISLGVRRVEVYANTLAERVLFGSVGIGIVWPNAC